MRSLIFTSQRGLGLDGVGGARRSKPAAIVASGFFVLPLHFFRTVSRPFFVRPMRAAEVGGLDQVFKTGLESKEEGCGPGCVPSSVGCAVCIL